MPRHTHKPGSKQQGKRAIPKKLAAKFNWKPLSGKALERAVKIATERKLTSQ